ncbi:MAG: DNA polymerase III subunit delta [Armatimonadota bacterium]
MSTRAAGERGDAPSVHLVHGPAELLKERRLAELTDELLPAEERELGLVQCDPGEMGVDAIVAAIRTPPMFASRCVVIVRPVDGLSAGDQGRLGEAARELAPGGRLILVTGPEEGGRRATAPVAAALRKGVKELGQAHFCQAPREWDVPKWLVSEAQALGKRLTPALATQFVGRAGHDMGRLRMELEKLATYMGDRAEITAEDIAAVVSEAPEHTIFELVDAIGSKQPARAMRMLEVLLPGGAAGGSGDRAGAALGALGMIARQLRLLWQARVLLDRRLSLARPKDVPADVAAMLPQEHNIIQTLKAHSFLAKRYAAQAGRFSSGELSRALERVAEAEMSLKGQLQGATGDEQLALELMIADLCSP